MIQFRRQPQHNKNIKKIILTVELKKCIELDNIIIISIYYKELPHTGMYKKYLKYLTMR